MTGDPFDPPGRQPWEGCELVRPARNPDARHINQAMARTIRLQLTTIEEHEMQTARLQQQLAVTRQQRDQAIRERDQAAAQVAGHEGKRRPA